MTDFSPSAGAVELDRIPPGAAAPGDGGISTALLLELYERLPHGVVVHGPDGAIVAANTAASRVLGLTHDALLGRTPPDPRWEAVDEQGRALPGEHHPASVARRTGLPVHDRLMGVFNPQHGERRWLRVTAIPHLAAGATVPSHVHAVFTDVTDEVEGARAAAFLATAGARLLASLDMEHTVGGLAELAVPYLADWCAIDVVEDGEVRRLAVHHADPAMRARAEELRVRYPARLDDAHGVGRVIRTGEMEHVPELSDELLAASTRDAEHLRIARELGLRSYVVLPLATGERVVGALTLVSAESRRPIGPHTVATARDLAERAAIALEHARLFAGLRAANHELDARRVQLEEQAVELEVSNQQLQEQQVELEATNQQMQEQQVELEMVNAQLQEQQVEMEAQAEELQATTEQLARQATELEAAHEDAVRARRRAEEANEAKGQFLAAMSHELRTPLNAITGYVDLLELGVRGALSDVQRDDLARIRRSGEHLLRLINDILQFAKLEAGQLEFRVSDVHLDSALRELEVLVAPQMRAKRISFGYSVGAEYPVARADRDKVQQIVLNLLTNAIKATEPGGSVRLEADVIPGARRAVVRVIDTGCGIPPEKRVTIFDPFVQVDRQLNRPGEGIGLGLAISRDLARTMGGELTVRSEVGKGSTFVLELPAA